MTGTTADDGVWVVVIGEVSAQDDAAVTLHHLHLDDERVIPIFRDPAVARQALEGSPLASKTMRIRVDLLRDILNGDERLLFDSGTGDPVVLRADQLHLLQVESD